MGNGQETREGRRKIREGAFRRCGLVRADGSRINATESADTGAMVCIASSTHIQASILQQEQAEIKSMQNDSVKAEKNLGTQASESPRPAPLCPFMIRGSGKWRMRWNYWQLKRALNKVRDGQFIILRGGCWVIGPLFVPSVGKV